MNEKKNHMPKLAGQPGAEEVKIRESALLEMAKALRALSIYPLRHPQRVKLMEQTFASLQTVLGRIGDFSCQVARTGFMHQNDKLGSENSMTHELAQEMHIRQIKSFSLRRELSLADFTHFMEILLEEPEQFRQGHFIEQWFQSHQIRTVWLNEIDFSRLVSSSAAEEEEIDQPTPPPLEHLFDELIARLELEQDPEKFGQLLREAEVLVRPFLENKQYQLPWKLTLSLSAQVGDDQRTGAAGESIRALAMRTLQGMVKGGFLNKLLERRAAPEPKQVIELDRLFGQLGPDLINPALEIMSRREAMQAYRPLLDLILGFGPAAIKLLEKRLADDNPVLVRKTIFCLGELKNRAAVEPLRPLLAHEEPRVRRETVRALIRIKGMESSRALAAALGSEKDDEARLLIIQGLAEARDLAAAPALINLLKKTPLREDGIEQAENLIDALGKIGSREALPVLIKLLNRRSLFNRELKMRARIKAAQALGQLGGESALQALARYARGRDTPLKKICTEVLEHLLKQEQT